MAAGLHFDGETDELGPDIDHKIEELMHLAGVRPSKTAARDWMACALPAGKHLAKGKGQPSLAEQNASVDRVRSENNRLIAALEGLRLTPTRMNVSGARSEPTMSRILMLSVLRTLRQATDDRACAELVDDRTSASSTSSISDSIFRKVFAHDTEQ